MKTISRRGALTSIGGALVGAVLARTSAVEATFCAPPGAQMWSTLGLSGAVILPAGLVVLDADASVSALTIPAGSTLMFHPDRTLTLTSVGNVVVAGTLDLSPADPANVHTVRITGAVELSTVGGGCDVLASDVGLWVTGVLNINGATKRGWTRSSTAIPLGATTLTVVDATGWRIGDQLAVTPTSGYDKFSDVTITAVNGTTVTVTPTQNAHPMSPPWNGVPLGAEVCNLTRNVVITGTSTARIHTMIHSTAPQTVRYCELVHTGPRVYTGEGTRRTGAVGRYGLHFHSCQDGSRGSIVEGVAAHHGGNKMFVPHASHGITFRDCVAHDGYENLYWWDATHVSNDITYDRCIASLCRPDVWFRGYRINGFDLREGKGNKVVDSCAVGVQGNSDAAGFTWPEAVDSAWEFRGNVSHNHAVKGFFAWQNSILEHFVADSFIYRCPVGIGHGAYVSAYRYERITVKDCTTAVVCQALSHPSAVQPTRFVDCDLTATGSNAIAGGHHNATQTVPVEFHRCAITGPTNGFFGVSSTSNPDKFDFVDCQFPAVPVAFPATPNVASVVRVQNGTTATQYTPAGSTPIASFFTGPLSVGAFTPATTRPDTVICTIPN